MKFPWSHTSIIDILKNDEKIEEKCQHIHKDILSKNLDISEFVTELGPALTDKDNEIRAKGTKLLSNVLEDLPVDFLDSTQLNFLTTFYCDRMKDHHSVIPPVLSGVLTLSQMTNLQEGAATKIVNAINLNIPCQVQAKDERAKIFNIIKNFSELKKGELLAMGADYIYFVINMMEGERDPRNLLFIFTFMPSFIKNFPLLHLAEEMFDVFSCYFPIDFHPSPNDPASITRNMLAEKLSDCLVSTDEFVEHNVELAMEKLGSNLAIAKLDACDLISKNCQEFKIDKIQPHFDDIWKALKVELLPGNDNKEIIQAVLNTLKSLLVCATEDPKTLDHILTIIFTTIMGSLAEVGSKLFSQCTKIALICASASSASAAYAGSKLLPLALSQFTNDHLEKDQKGILLELMKGTLIICKEKSVIVDLNRDMLNGVQKEFVQTLLQNTDKNLSKICLDALTMISEIITDENRFAVYTTILKILSSNDETLDLDVDDCLFEYALKHPIEVQGLIVDKLLDRKYDDSVSTKNILRALTKLIKSDLYKEKILKFLFKIIFDFEAKDDTLSVVAVRTLKDLLEAEDSKQLINELYEKFQFIDRIYQKIHTDFEFSSDYLYECSMILRLIMKNLSVDQQTEVIKTYLKTMNLEIVGDLYFTSGILGFLDETVPLEDHFESLVNDLSKIAMETKDETVRELCHHLLCSLFNKMPDDEKHRNILKSLILTIRKEIQQHNKQAVKLLSWIAKGLLSKGHVDAAEIVEDLAELLDHPSLGNAAAFAFEVLSVEFPQLHLPVIKHLFKQKLFVLVMKKFETAIEKYTESHLNALVYVFKIAPHMVLKMQIDRVGPVLFKCLDLEDEKPIYTALMIINNFLNNSDDYFRDHLQHLVGQLLILTTFKNSMKVRIEALTCLLNIAKYPTFVLLPYKQDVVLGLQTALDDNKRLVRAAAVEARLKWFLVGSVEEEPNKK